MLSRSYSDSFLNTRAASPRPSSLPVYNLRTIVIKMPPLDSTQRIIEQAEKSFIDFLRKAAIPTHYYNNTDRTGPRRHKDRNGLTSLRIEKIKSDYEWSRESSSWRTRDGKRLLLERELWPFLSQTLCRVHCRDDTILYHIMTEKYKGVAIQDVTTAIQIFDECNIDRRDDVRAILCNVESAEG